MIGSFNILFLVHMLALSAAGTAMFGVAMVKAHLDPGLPGVKPLIRQFDIVGGIGFAVLILSGLLMVWLNGFGLAGMPLWFWVKMALLVAVFAGAGVQLRAARAAAAGNRDAARAEAWVDWALRALFVAVIAAAVLAFG